MLMLMLFSHKGFHTRNSIWKSPYENLGGNTLNIVMPNISLIFSQLYKYPNKSQVRTGGDYLAALYLGEALNFTPKYEEKIEQQSPELLFVFQGNKHYRWKVGISGGQGNKLFQWNDRNGSEKGKNNDITLYN